MNEYEPLTDEEINQIADNLEGEGEMHLVYARAIEAAVIEKMRGKV